MGMACRERHRMAWLTGSCLLSPDGRARPLTRW